MAITTVPQFSIPNAWVAWPITGMTTIGPINASGDRIAMVVQCPKAGTLSLFETMTATVGNNPDNGLRFSFQDVSLTTGDPDTTQDQYCDITGTISSNTWLVPGHALTHDGSSGGNKRTVAAGELLACVVDFVSFVASDSVTFQGYTNFTGNWRNFYLDDGSAGTYSKSTTVFLPMALKYDDGTYAEFFAPVYPISTVTSTTYNSGSAADERALVFTVPIPMRAIGCWVGYDVDGNTDMVLYNGTTSLASASMDPDVRNQGSAGIAVVYFDSKVTLTPGNTYYLSAKPTSGTSLTTYEWNVNANALMAAIPGGTSWVASTRVDAGSWAASTTTRRPQVGVIFDGVDTYYSSGGLGGSAFFG